MTVTYTASSLVVVAALIAWATGEQSLGGSRLLLLAAFFALWFFRDPHRNIPAGYGLIVSPADGVVTETVTIATPDGQRQRISIFLSVFDVHVNRAPISGILKLRFAIKRDNISKRDEPFVGGPQQNRIL